MVNEIRLLFKYFLFYYSKKSPISGKSKKCARAFKTFMKKAQSWMLYKRKLGQL